MSNKSIRKNVNQIINELEDSLPIKYSIDQKTAFDSEHLVTRVPVDTYSHDPKEDDIALMKELRDTVDEDGKIFTGLDPEKYSGILKKKNEEFEAEQLRRYVFKNIKNKSPYEIQKLQEMFPEVYQDAEKAIDETSKLYEMLAEINFRGPQSREHWLLLYNVWLGKVQFDSEVLNRIMGIKGSDQIKTEDDYEWGILSPKRYKKMKYDQTVKLIDPFVPYKNDGTINYKNDTMKIKSFLSVFGDALGKIFSV